MRDVSPTHLMADTHRTNLHHMCEHLAKLDKVGLVLSTTGGGIAVSMPGTTFSAHNWQGYDNVIEALNLPHDLFQTGRKYISPRVVQL